MLNDENNLNNSEQLKKPFITIVSFTICIIIWFGILLEGDSKNILSFEKWGFYSYQSILNGSYWGLLTAAFVHENFVHIFFNIYFLYVVGTIIENEIGYFKYFILIITSAIASSTLQLVFTETTGIGISGVLYAFVGLIWSYNKYMYKFQRYFGNDFINSALIWLLLAWILTDLGMMNIANWAHLGGFLWGALFGNLILKRNIILSLIFSMGFITLSVISITWAPWSDAWNVNKAIKEFMENKPKNAIRILKDISKKKKKDVYALLVLATILEEQKQYDEATKYLNEVLKIDSNNFQAKKFLAVIRINQKDYKEAMKLVSELLKINPDDFELNNYQGILHLKMNNYNEAISIYQSMVLKSPEEYKATVYYNLACAYSLKNEKAQAIKYLRIAIAKKISFKNDAFSDKDFENIKNEKEFLDLLK